MTEETRITFIGALGIAAIVLGVIVVVWHLLDQQKPGPQPGQSHEATRLQ